MHCTSYGYDLCIRYYLISLSETMSQIDRTDPVSTSTVEPENLDIAVLVPCYNEEKTVIQVVEAFRDALPNARIFVYDNNSSDKTAEFAKKAGAVVRHELLQGKGNVVRRMFADIDADVYVMCDGDLTYDIESAPVLVDHLINHNLDMVNGARVDEDIAAYRPGHRFGNWLLTTIVQKCFGKRIEDMLSGYRIFSYRFVKSFPAHASGFETETELTVHALSLRMPIGEVKTRYFARPIDSHSKLSTYRDGIRILITILKLVKSERPLMFFGFISIFLTLTAIGIAVPTILLPWFATGEVIRLATAILVTGIMILSALSLNVGLILHTVTLGRIEVRRLHYLQLPLLGKHQAK